MATATNVGDIYSLLDKVSSLLKSDIKTLVDNIDLLDDEYKDIKEDATDKKSEIETKIYYAYKIIQDFTIISKEINSKFIHTNQKINEGEVIAYITDKLSQYGMLDISISTKGKITIDLKHCNEIEEL